MLARFMNAPTSYKLIEDEDVAIFTGPFGEQALSLRPFKDGPWFEEELVIYCVRQLIYKQAEHFLR